jgi:transcriptional regulator with XRE-family HTH domain
VSKVNGARLRQLRKKKGFTQARIAEIIGLNRVSYSHYESNKNSPPSDKLSVLVDILDTTADYLLDKTGNPLPLPAEQIGGNEITDLIYENEHLTYHGVPISKFDRDRIVDMIKVILKRQTIS